MYYYGVYKADPSSNITLPAYPYNGGYRALNGDYAYEVLAGKLIVLDNGAVILDQSLRRTS